MLSKKVLLIDVDGKIPNIPLMKLSTYYKNKGYFIDLKRLNYVYYPKKRIETVIDGAGYELIFVSIIFPINRKVCNIINCDNVIYGGIGFDLTIKLDECIENIEPDYSIYPDNDTSYGFITRGCIRNCKFCVVPKKEGMIHQVNTIDNIVKHKKVKFLDNNILAFNKCEEIFQELIDKKIKCQFNQGLDIRLLDDKKAYLLSKIYYINEYIFAFDNIKELYIINEKLKLFKKYIKKPWKIKFFIYCHPDMDIQEDLLCRILWCKQNKVYPYLMRDISCWNSKNRGFYIYLAGWCNQPSLFKLMTFREYMMKKTKNPSKQKENINIFYNEEEVVE